VLVFIDQVVETFFKTDILLVAEVVEMFGKYGVEVGNDIVEELEEMFF
jgi:hypothetical protein